MSNFFIQYTQHIQSYLLDFLTDDSFDLNKMETEQ